MHPSHTYNAMIEHHHHHHHHHHHRGGEGGGYILAYIGVYWCILERILEYLGVNLRVS